MDAQADQPSIEQPEADWAEQHTDVEVPDEDAEVLPGSPGEPLEADEADVADQSTVVQDDDPYPRD